MAPIRKITVLGGGSAGFIAALTLKRKIPDLKVTVIRSPHLGIIGVGEGTTANFPKHFHEYLGLKPERFFAEAQPIWKLGIRYLWGPRASFNYTFTAQTDYRHRDLPKNNGYYCDDDFSNVDLSSALMDEKRIFARQPNGAMQVFNNFGYHIENKKLVGYLEARARDFGVSIIDATVIRVRRLEEGGVAALVLDTGSEEVADLFVDASGFHAELLGLEFKEPFVDYSDSLFSDRAVVGGWPREEGEPIQPYTTAETMDAGWCWRIDHEEIINRGYVFCSAHISDEEAEAEYRRKNPRAGQTRIVKFRTGRYQRQWVHNVVAIGNAAGFVEPLEASALMTICLQSQGLTDALIECDLQPSDSMVKMYNIYMASLWDEVRDFLAVHYKFNSRIDTPYWRRCQEETALHGAEGLIEFYKDNGPSVLSKSVLVHPVSPFGIEGYYTLLVGQQVPYQRRHHITSKELALWNNYRKKNQMTATHAFGVKEALSQLRDPRWCWV